MIFAMMVGVAGSGKSTLAQEIIKEYNKPFVVISSDKVRYELFDDENDQSDNGRVFNECHKRIFLFLKADNNVMFDATNLSAKRRYNLLKEIDRCVKDCKKHAHVIVTDPSIIESRMEERERKVPIEVVKRQIGQFQCPGEWEGWDEIYLYRNSELTREYETFNLLKKAIDISQDNHWHKHSIGNHILKAITKYQSDGEDDLVFLNVLKHHDLGKIFTKTFINYKGETTEEAHFYNHQNWSAYIYLLNFIHSRDLYSNGFLPHNSDEYYFLRQDIRIANLIQYHMDYYLRGEKFEDFHAKTGYLNDLKLIHLYDEYASQ